MARIRTVKPEFFRHERLFEADKETGLPLRLAFIGLWTAADREGRFRWQPRALKLDCLPYDDVDFSRVLDALESRGLIVAYEVEGVKYGHIPSWQKHQIVNNREMASSIPAPNENNILTREPRVNDASSTPLKHAQGEGKGREKERKELSSASRSSANASFEELKRRYPKRLGDYKWKLAERKFNSLVKTGVPPSAILNAATRLAETHSKLGNIGTQFVPMPASWLNSEDFLEVAVEAFEAEKPVDWDAICDSYKRFGVWSKYAPGNAPDSSSCQCPPEILKKYGLLFEPREPVVIPALKSMGAQ